MSKTIQRRPFYAPVAIIVLSSNPLMHQGGISVLSNASLSKKIILECTKLRHERLTRGTLLDNYSTLAICKSGRKDKNKPEGSILPNLEAAWGLPISSALLRRYVPAPLPP